MTKLGIYGCGGMGRELLFIARQQYPELEIVFVEDMEHGSSIFGVPVIRFSDLTAGDLYILSMGNGRIRRLLDAKCASYGLVAASLFAPSFIREYDVAIGEGAVFCHHTMATVSLKIGKQFQCNRYSYVSHDCVIGDYVTFSPRVSCNGNVHIEDDVFIGSGAVIRNGTPDKPIVIGTGAVVGMGAIVTGDVAPGVTVVGCPARPKH